MSPLCLPSRASCLAVSIVVLCLLCPPVDSAAASGWESAGMQADKTRSMAESQHEIVLILIKKKDYEQALVEANKIFQMKWQPEQESLLLKDLLLITDQLLHAGQAAAGVKLIEANLNAFKATASRVSIWKEKGYLYKTMGESDRALECFRQAQKLEK
jgi:tetratricopeptide (TPR) repeat protein